MSRRHSFIVLLVAALLAIPLLAFAGDNQTKGAKPAHISQGKEVTLADYLVPGKTTIFDFYSEYCPPCRAIAPRLEVYDPDGNLKAEGDEAYELVNSWLK